MPRLRVAMLAVAGVFVLAAPPAAASDDFPKGVEWMRDWNAALRSAADRGVPLLVSFANDD